MGEEFITYFDGSCEGNEQPDPSKRKMRGAFVVGGVNQVKAVRESQGWPATNNTAEYLGLHMLLSFIYGHGPWPEDTKFIICGDSKLVIEQMRGAWRVGKPHLWELRRIAENMIGSMSCSFEFRWVPRAQNPAGRLLEGSPR